MSHDSFAFPYSSTGGYAPPAAAATARMTYSGATATPAAAAAGVAYRGQMEPLQCVTTQQQMTYTRQPGGGGGSFSSLTPLGLTGSNAEEGGGFGSSSSSNSTAANFNLQQHAAAVGMGFTFRDFFRVVRDKEKLSLWLSTHRGSLQLKKRLCCGTAVDAREGGEVCGRHYYTRPKKVENISSVYLAFIAWMGFIVVVLIVYHLFSDGDFSFLMTLSSLISMFSFLMVVYKIEANGSAAGVSLKMMECYVVLIFARLCSIIPFEGYLPYDRSGDWLYQTVEALSFLLAGTIVYLCRSRYGNTYEAGVDTLNHLFLIVPSAVLAVLFHPSLNAFMPADMAWTFALYLETVAVLPQLFMFQREGKVEPFTTHFLAGQVLSQAFSFIFWVSSYSELNGPQNSLKSYVGHWVIGMQVVQLIVMADFIYHYVRCLSKGVPVQYMLSENV